MRLVKTDINRSDSELKAVDIDTFECGDRIRRLEDELLHQRMRFELMCRASDGGLWSMEIDPGHTLHVNTPFWWSNQFRNLLGYQDEGDFPNVMGSWSNLLHPDDKQRILNTFGAHLADPTGRTPFTVEYRLKCRDGVHRWFRTKCSTQRDTRGNPLRAAGALILIEEQKRREAELDTTLTRFEMSREMLNDGIWDLAVVNGNPFNPNNEFWWSPQFRRLLGFETEAEFPNVLSSWTSRLHPDDEATVMLAFIAHLSDKSGKTPYDIEYRLRDRHDAYHYFRARGQTKRARDGTPLRAIGALTNIDDLKNLLAAENAKAEYQLVLASSMRDIREEERVALAREVHDQLGQVLSAAKIDIKLLEDDIRPIHVPLSRRRIARELRSARQSIEKAIQSVREISANLRSPELDDHGLFAAITWHVQDFERRARIKCAISISDAVGEPAGLIAVALFRIFQEATTNILRHAKASQAWVSLDRRGEAILLRVRDNGVGIDPAAARNGHSTGIKGMRERVALVNGRLTVAPLQPQGTLVSVRIPVAADRGLFDIRGAHDHATSCPGRVADPRRQTAD